MIGYVLYCVSTGLSLMAGHVAIQLVALALCIALLAYLEGIQVAILRISPNDEDLVAAEFPRALYTFEALVRDRKIAQFLLGRQFLVIFVVFVISRITSFSNAPELGMPGPLFWALIKTGIPGALLALALGQLLPQLLGKSHPLHMLNWHGVYSVVRFTLLVEQIGFTHFSRAITMLAKRSLGYTKQNEYNGAAAEFNVDRVVEASADHIVEQRPRDMQQFLQHLSDATTRTDTYVVTPGIALVKSYPSIMEDDGKVHMTPHPAQFPLLSECRSHYKAHYPDRTLPKFLLEPNHEDHIPPHVVAYRLALHLEDEAANQQVAHLM
jgi:Silicon transporter